MLAAIWLVATFASTVRLIGGFLLVGAIRRRAQTVSSPVPTTLLATLSSRLGLSTHVELLESSDVDVPVTAGWRRPAVLLPVGLASKLDDHALEIVLAHELVHIRRADYLWGIFQSVGDVLTAPSPGHQWLSREGRRLCEDACDDEVVALGIERTRYARMLESLAHWSRGKQLPAAVCAASRNLPARIRRLVSEVTDTPSRPALLGAGVLFCMAMAIACLGASLSAQRPPAGEGRNDQARTKPMLPFMFQPEATGVPFRIVGVEPSEQFAVEYITVASVYPKRIVSVQVGADVHPNGRTPADDLLFEMFGVRSAAMATNIEPGRSARLAVRFITAEESAEFRRATGIPELGMRLYPAVAAFEDGSSWVGGSPATVPPLTIPRALVSSVVPKPASGPSDVWTCYDPEAHQTSEGGVAPIREDPQRFVRCTNGRWVEIALGK
jgi:beta-lactamase regulating signal transducer with metallopeptidase domain